MYGIMYLLHANEMLGKICDDIDLVHSVTLEESSNTIVGGSYIDVRLNSGKYKGNLSTHQI